MTNYGELRAEWLTKIELIEAAEWNNLVGLTYPFIRYEFLWAMEESGCVGGDSGWQARHLTVRNKAGALVAVAPSYLKEHSYGEFTFDWSWANAYSQNRLNYYPKLITAMPFTPCAGPRIAVRA